MNDVISLVVDTLSAWSHQMSVIAIWCAALVVIFILVVPFTWRVVSFTVSDFGLYLLERRLNSQMRTSPARLSRSQISRALQTLACRPETVRVLMGAAPGRDRFLAAYATAVTRGFSRPACDVISAEVHSGGDLNEMAGYLSSTSSMDEAVAAYKAGIPLEYAAVAFAR